MSIQSIHFSVRYNEPAKGPATGSPFGMLRQPEKRAIGTFSVRYDKEKTDAHYASVPVREIGSSRII